jgi:hypothetical protein
MMVISNTKPIAEVINLFSGAGSMLEGVTAIAIIAGGIGALFAGIAAMRLADAWKIWAGRCDPMNPNFRPPSLWRRR